MAAPVDFDITNPGLVQLQTLFAADRAAAAAAYAFGAGEDQALNWFAAGEDLDTIAEAAGDDGPFGAAFNPAGRREVALELLAEFVRANPRAGTEALYRYAAGKRLHRGPHEAFEAQPFWLRAALHIFATVLQVSDVMARLEVEALDQAAATARAGGPVMAAALAEGQDMAGTALELQPDPLAMQSWVPPAEVGIQQRQLAEHEAIGRGAIAERDQADVDAAARREAGPDDVEDEDKDEDEGEPLEEEHGRRRRRPRKA